MIKEGVAKKEDVYRPIDFKEEHLKIDYFFWNFKKKQKSFNTEKMLADYLKKINFKFNDSNKFRKSIETKIEDKKHAEFTWSEEQMEHYPNTYKIWLEECPFCDEPVSEHDVITDANKNFCKNCGGLIIGKWTQAGYHMINEVISEDPYMEVSYRDFCEKLRDPEYFMLTFTGFDDMTEHYMEALWDCKGIPRWFDLLNGEGGYLIKKNPASKSLLLDGMREGYKGDYYIKNWNNLFWLNSLNKAI